MFKNCVFRVGVNTKEWLKSAGIRAIKTIAQCAAAGISTSVVLGDVNWRYVLSAAALAGIYSILTSIGGVPEVENSNGKGE